MWLNISTRRGKRYLFPYIESRNLEWNKLKGKMKILGTTKRVHFLKPIPRQIGHVLINGKNRSIKYTVLKC